MTEEDREEATIRIVLVVDMPLVPTPLAPGKVEGTLVRPVMPQEQAIKTTDHTMDSGKSTLTSGLGRTGFVAHGWFFSEIVIDL